ncbi:acetone carboxylase subunit gamma [Halorubellus salinus]|uniref:acetone carboxylase subunit gamma n=1 Tax=Halorubellus salinus TaxID=755309 RepID=UPI001D06B3D4|nr:acetone carboxylase subunit gamma [Halorubellus salinus]
MHVGPSLDVGESDVSCSHCDEHLAGTDESLKTQLPVREGPITNAGPTMVDEDRFVSEEMVFREFFCPGCGALLFTETARKGDPVLEEFRIEAE